MSEEPKRTGKAVSLTDTRPFKDGPCPYSLGDIHKELHDEVEKQILEQCGKGEPRTVNLDFLEQVIRKRMEEARETCRSMLAVATSDLRNQFDALLGSFFCGEHQNLTAMWDYPPGGSWSHQRDQLFSDMRRVFLERSESVLRQLWKYKEEFEAIQTVAKAGGYSETGPSPIEEARQAIELDRLAEKVTHGKL